MAERVATTRLAEATGTAVTAVTQVRPATEEVALTERNSHRTAGTVVTAAIRARQVLVVPAEPAVPAEQPERMAPPCHPVDTEATAVVDLLDSIPVCPVVTVAKAELVAQLEMAAPVATEAMADRWSGFGIDAPDESVRTNGA